MTELSSGSGIFIWTEKLESRARHSGSRAGPFAFDPRIRWCKMTSPPRRSTRLSISVHISPRNCSSRLLNVQANRLWPTLLFRERDATVRVQFKAEKRWNRDQRLRHLVSTARLPTDSWPTNRLTLRLPAIEFTERFFMGTGLSRFTSASRVG